MSCGRSSVLALAVGLRCRVYVFFWGGGVCSLAVGMLFGSHEEGGMGGRNLGKMVKGRLDHTSE